jgi:hypothetical protein
MKMKKFWLLLILLACLAGCKAVPTDQENSGFDVVDDGGCHHCCEGICVEIKVDEPLVFGEPITVRITATTEEDVPDLGVTLTFIPFDNIIIEDPDEEEEGIVISQRKSDISWRIDAKANQLITFVRELTYDISLIENSYLGIIVDAHTPYGLVVTNYVDVSFSTGEVKVYYPGTPFPTSEYKTKYEGTEPPIYPTPGVTITREPIMTAIATYRHSTAIPTMRWSTPIPPVNPYPIITPQPVQPTPTLPPYP